MCWGLGPVSSCLPGTGFGCLLPSFLVTQDPPSLLLCSLPVTAAASLHLAGASVPGCADMPGHLEVGHGGRACPMGNLGGVSLLSTLIREPSTFQHRDCNTLGDHPFAKGRGRGSEGRGGTWPIRLPHRWLGLVAVGMGSQAACGVGECSQVTRGAPQTPASVPVNTRG